MADRTLRLTATFNDAGALTGLKVLNAELGNTETSGKKGKTGLFGFGQGLTDIQAKAASMTAAVALVGAGLKQVYDAAKEGAELELAEQRFDNLTASIGTTSDAILTKLTSATAGMMSNAEMISGASQIISLGLADTEEGEVDLAALIGQLGWDMNQVIMTFANNSKMRLDALGLSVEDVEAKTQKFIEQGHSMDEAFDLAVIEAGQEKLDLLGSAADSNLGKMERAEAQIENFTNSLKQGLVPWLGNAAQAAVTLFTSFDSTNQMLDTHNQEVAASSDSYEAYVAEMERAISAAGLVLGVSGMQAQKQQILTEEVWKAVHAAEELEASEEKLAIARSNQTGEIDAQVTTLFELVQAYGKAGITTESYTEAQEAAAQAVEDTRQAMSDLQFFMDGPLGEEFDSFIQQNTDLEAKAAELRAEIAALGGTEYMTPAQAAQITTLQGQLNNVTVEILALDDSIQSGELKNNQEYAATQNLEELREKAWELEQQILALGGQPFVTSANLEDLAGLREEYAQNQDAIAALAEEHRKATLQILMDLASQRAAADGVITGDEFAVLTNLAADWGLIDETTKNATLAMDGYFAELNAGNATVTETTEAITAYGDQLLANEEAHAKLDEMLAADIEQMQAMTDATTGASDAQTIMNETLAEKGVGALTDYRNTLLELEEPMTHNAELIGTAAETAGKFNNELNAIPGTYNATINITTNGTIPVLPGSTGVPTGPGASQNFATGTDSFIVPSGHPNDSYMVGLTSGEKFSVQTPAQQLREAFGEFGGSGGSVTNVFQIYQMPGENAEMLARRVAQILQEKNR